MYKPVIGVVMCRNRLKGHQTQTLQEKYLNAIVNAGGLPIALPHALAEPELLEHREDPELPVEQQYAPSHQVEVQEGGLLSQLIPGCNTFWVNSLHGQGAKTLGSRLRVEARSPDGLVEAVSVNDHPFALGVQWHPEWNSSEYALSRMLFDGFITACQSHVAEKRRL
ncbi:TPA: gamma-glutamyl-gamma-aminobutyrate hydrolase family protein [Klebsiella aerogenes]|uniref:gamma-glutamyl-gamma-aminobutyrate hydrolase family protein n=1 Tax=Klebsiella aerogenes TaxID=548 RepID=UPI001BD077F9|nr:gamma-glutamyl-gamma-aminobutyrate hydrolase family protein [Klebsiella aerogenes]HDS2186524.1 gamma-glutamyl-gamma-aminobutyrate hydrolase family protein [Klebsiella aerogenes]HDT0437103.1 gamma-glutamyl-gamma-aminobutyrate hydrolase family protein [Klebsiella aerogenes]HDT4802159.1 gamma-glutamyl-gamma-aminobutyrate hydrolase family protein [Klebsiella aerogenes]HDU4049371.1 gamma-glutamyl-gamma-aminobutyrate hydrolase family protein [Klebsiella aerogenes]HDU5787652.1 gamma-glutamyl-gamma